MLYNSYQRFRNANIFNVATLKNVERFPIYQNYLINYLSYERIFHKFLIRKIATMQIFLTLNAQYSFKQDTDNYMKDFRASHFGCELHTLLLQLQSLSAALQQNGCQSRVTSSSRNVIAFLVGNVGKHFMWTTLGTCWRIIARARVLRYRKCLPYFCCNVYIYLNLYIYIN